MTISPQLIIKNLQQSPETQALLRRFAKEQGISIEQSFTGTPRPRRIALVGKSIAKNATLSMSNKIDSAKTNQELNRILKKYFKN